MNIEPQSVNDLHIIFTQNLPYLIQFFVGIGVGVLGYLLGIGGGVLIVPVLVLLLDMPAHQAVAISLVVIVANSMNISLKHLKSGVANIRIGILLSITAVIGSLVASIISVGLNANTILIILGVIQFVVAIATYIKSRTTKQYIPLTEEDEKDFPFFAGKYIDKSTKTEVKYKPIRMFTAALTSTLAGLFAGIAGVGGGILLIPTMNLISYVPIKAATATSGLIIGFTAFSASVVYISAGYLDSNSMILIIHMILGLQVGASLSNKFLSAVTDKNLSYLLIALLLVASVQILFKAFR